MKNFVMVNSAGIVTQVGSSDDVSYADWKAKGLPVGYSMVEVEDYISNFASFMVTSYCNNGTIVSRNAMSPIISATTIASDGTAATTITALPNPCSITISGPVTVAPTTVTGGQIVLTSNEPGNMIVNVTSEPSWVPWSTTIDVV